MPTVIDTKPAARPTITDIARACGVSKVTVSYVLNGRERNIKISDLTKERVKAAARDLGYHPNALARGLANSRTNVLSLVLQYATVYTGGSAFITELMHSAVTSASELDFDLMLHTKRRESIEQEIAGLLDGRSEGALLLRDTKDPVAGELARRKFPAVHIFSHADDEALSSVDCDNVAGGRLATQYLIGLGHRRIGHLYGSAEGAAARERRVGYDAAMTEAGLEAREQWSFTASYAGANMSPLLDVMSRSDKPTALFCWSDDVAASAIKYLSQEMGLRVPDDVSVVGFDSTPFCEHTTPHLTSIRQPFQRITDSAIGLLRDMIESRRMELQTIRFEPHLDERQSCRAL